MKNKFTIMSLAILVTGCATLTPIAKFTPEVTSISIVEPSNTNGLYTIETNNTPSSTFTQTPISTVTSTPTPAPTPTLDLPENYGYGIYFALLGWDAYSYGVESSLTNFPSGELPRSAGEFEKLQAIYLEFAHFADQMAYWTADDPGQLWVSDLTLKQVRRIFTDTQRVYLNYPSGHVGYPNEEIKQIWSQGDKHLIIEVPSNQHLNLIYHLESKQLETFPYTCNSVALSPKSGLLATWCVSEDDQSFKIIERDGQIWKGKEAPSNEIVQRITQGQQTWEWSADGEYIIYYDMTDDEMRLVISDVRGNPLIKILPYSACWLKPELCHGVRSTKPPSKPLQWSQDGTRLIVWGSGNENRPCQLAPSQNFSVEQLSCWQVIDSKTGVVLWTTVDSIPLFITNMITPESISPRDFLNPAVSPDGRFLVIYAFIGIRQWVIIDLDNNNTEVYGGNYLADIVRWGSVPESP